MTYNSNAKSLKSLRNRFDEVWYEPGKNGWRITYTFDQANHEHQKLIKHFRTPPLACSSSRKMADALEKCALHNRCLTKVCILCNRARQRMVADGVCNHE